MIFGGYHLNKKKKSNKSGYPDEAIKTLARCFYPSMVEFFNSEEGQREYEEWLKEQEALQASVSVSYTHLACSARTACL